LSQTYEGKRHDKKIVDEETPTYPVDIGVYKDTGFQGYEPEGVQTFQPQKKPTGKELTPEQKSKTVSSPASGLSLSISLLGLNDVALSKTFSEIRKKSMTIS
jgi:hypothetical protein